ncbi:MAG: STAS domain-containing protein [Armatimonadetes bacterium]|nr:STAS domain-containing protein [Armatimonadota bacterium]
MYQDLVTNVRLVDSAFVVDLEGDLTPESEQAVGRLHDELMKNTLTALVLNFSRVKYINSGGIAVLINLVTRVKDKGIVNRIRGFGLTSHFQRIFRMVGLDQYIELLETETQALS